MLNRVAAVLCACSLFLPITNTQESASTDAYTQGLERYDHANWTAAAESFEEALIYQPQHPPVWYNLALTYFQLNDFLEAERHLEKLLAIDPFFENAHQLYGMILYRRGEYARAIKAFNYAIAVHPTRELRLARAVSYMATGMPRYALPDFDEILHDDPGHPGACLGKSAALIELEQYDYALRFLNRILDNDPDHMAALVNRALCYFHLGQDDQSTDDFNRAVSLGPTVPTLLAKAKCHLLKNQFMEARADIRSAIRLAPNTPGIYFLLGEMEMQQEKYDAAIESFEISLSLDHRCYDCHLLKSEALARRSDYDQAVTEIYKVLDLEPEHEKAKEMLRWIYAKMDKERGKTDAEKKEEQPGQIKNY